MEHSTTASGVGNELPNLAQEFANARLARAETGNPKAESIETEQGVSATRIATVSRLMRAMGASVILVAALTFLFQRWGSIDHITRYLSFLGFTGLLSAAGFLCGLKLREDKGARTFLAIAAAMIPINFCALGGLGYSRVLANSGTVREYHEAIRWVAPSDFAAISVSICAALVLGLLSFVSFSALQRGLARRLSAVFIFSNALLLVPSREVNVTALMTVLLFIALVRFDLKSLRTVSVRSTGEGLLCRVLMFLPFFALLGRTLNLYLVDLNALFLSSILAAFALFLFKYLPQYLGSVSAKERSQLLSVIPAAGAWALLVTEGTHTFQIQGIVELCLLTVPFSGLLLCMSCLTSPSLGQRLRWSAALLAVATAGLSMLLFPGVGASFLCVMVALPTTVEGYLAKRQATFFLGLAGLVFGLAQHLHFALDVFGYSPWVSLALLGTITVIGSSYLERNFKSIAERFSRLTAKAKIE